MNFGEHVTIDGYKGNYEKLNNRDLVMGCLNKLPALLHMTQLSSPEVYFAKGNDLKDPGGWSGFVVIEESHISIHTFPARGFISADVYTCKNGLNKDLIINFFKDIFLLEDVESNLIQRGTRYPDHDINNI